MSEVESIYKSVQKTDIKELKNKDFKSEKELKDYIILNKEAFCREVLGIEYKDHRVEYKMPQIKYLYTNEPVVDIVFIDQNDLCYFVELKNPKHAYNELCAGLTQSLAYRYLAGVTDMNYGGSFLVTTKHSGIIPLIIRDNNIDITYIYFDKTKHSVFHT